MTKTDDKENLVYVSPILIPLGSLAKGSGVCTAGSSVISDGGGGDDGSGNGDSNGNGGSDICVITDPITDCTGGGTANQDCTAGPTACRNCSEGTDATVACDAGVAATTACTAGTAN